MDDIKKKETQNNTNLNASNIEREKMLQEMLKNNQLSCMTEVAYGEIIADRETPDKKKNKEE